MENAWFNQRTRDRQRKTYKVFFPSDLTPEQIATFLNGISGSMHRKGGILNLGEPTPSLVFEVWATVGGIEHWLKVPWQYEESVVPTLLTLVPGMRVVTEDPYPSSTWTRVTEYREKNSHRLLHIPDASALSANILSSFSHMDAGETLMMQWVVTPAARERKQVYGEVQTKELGLDSFYKGSLLASRDEVDERNSKQSEQNFAAALRISATAATDERAGHLISKVYQVLKSTNGPTNQIVERQWVRNLQERVDLGKSPDPTRPPFMLTVSELAGLVGWRPGGVHIPGMPALVARSLPAAENVPREGRVVGVSNFHGRERKVAMSYAEALKHVYLCGGTGVGKTTAMANMIAQDMQNGYGLIVIENKGDLFDQALDYVPRERLNDVVVLDINDQSWPVGFNVLQQGNPSVAVDELLTIFNKLFADRESMWMQEVMYNALHTLAQDKTGTFMDVRALADPKPSEEAWAQHLRENVHDPEIRDWWADFKTDKNRESKLAPLKSRLWPIMRSNLINIFGQSKSGFSMADIVRDNKILLINLAGLEPIAANLAGTIFTNAVWQAVKAHPVKTPNFLYIDEFQSFLKLPVDPEDMLAKSRSFGLGLVLANQHLAQLTDDMRDAIMSNAHTKIIFQAGDPTDARRLAASFGRMVTPEDFTSLGRYEALARIATDKGNSAPLTMSTLPPMEMVGLADRVRYASRGNYGKRVDEVQAELAGRRTGYAAPKARRTPPKRDTPY